MILLSGLLNSSFAFPVCLSFVVPPHCSSLAILNSIKSFPDSHVPPAPLSLVVHSTFPPELPAKAFSQQPLSFCSRVHSEKYHRMD